MTVEELKNTYSSLSTKDLLQIVDNKFDYTDFAVSIALAELSTRQVSEEDIKNYKEDVIENEVSFINRNISNDLSLLQKILFYFIWPWLINSAFKRNFLEDGYILKLKQSNYYSLIGFLTFFVTGFFSLIYDFSNLTSLCFWIICFLPAYIFDEAFNRQSQIIKLKKIYGIDENEAEPEEDL